ncbi:MAG: DUF11 domain-containing protein [Verrucomicrobia bacterium]|nr:DUF11 domain-containing protein [Verrucomicrobiota bacterium]
MSLTRYWWCLITFLGLSFVPAQMRGADVETSVTALPNPVSIGTTLTVTLSLTNTSGLTLTNLVVTNTLPSSAAFLNVSVNTGIVSQISSLVIALTVRFLTNNGDLQFTIRSQPNALGSITNSLDVAATNQSLALTNFSVVNQVVSGFSDLAAGVSGPSDVLLTGDHAAFFVNVTNRGPNAASSVVVSNLFSSGASLVSLSPSNASVSFTGTNLVLNLASLPAGGTQQIQCILAPIQSSAFVFTSTVQAESFHDTNTLDNTSSLTTLVTNALPGVLSITSIDASNTVDLRTGLMLQRIRVENAGATTVNALRLSVAGLTRTLLGLTDRLHNAHGTNNGVPFVVIPGTLAPSESVVCILEFFFPSRTSSRNFTYSSIEVPLPVFTVSGDIGVEIDATSFLSASEVLVEFTAVEGRRYSMLYSDSPGFTVYRAVQPSFIAPGSRVQWIDGGPPKTISPPTASPARYYRVLQLP